MIVPLLDEADWLTLLAPLPSWNPTAQRILVLAPHPDDETLGAGGFIARATGNRVPVEVIAATDGEHAYEDNAGLAERRTAEQTAALAVLGVPSRSVHRLHLPDSGLSGHEPAIEAACQRLGGPGTLLIAPWTGDFHPDHEACGRAASAAAERSGATVAFYLFWTWHRGDLTTLAGKNIRRFELSPAELALKTRALACHPSQLHNEAEGAILPEDLLGPARRPFEVFLFG
jgi:LmbE family N-acetylglucosaminyl deacetylase